MPFREKVTALGEKSLEIIEQYLDGKKAGGDLVREASKMISQAVKVEHMNQIQKNMDRSFALRLIPYLPKEKEVIDKYIEMTNPQVRGLLESRPKK
jgi:hypothetical protein